MSSLVGPDEFDEATRGGKPDVTPTLRGVNRLASLAIGASLVPVGLSDWPLSGQTASVAIATVGGIFAAWAGISAAVVHRRGA